MIGKVNRGYQASSAGDLNKHHNTGKLLQIIHHWPNCKARFANKIRVVDNIKYKTYGWRKFFVSL